MLKLIYGKKNYNNRVYYEAIESMNNLKCYSTRRVLEMVIGFSVNTVASNCMALTY